LEVLFVTRDNSIELNAFFIIINTCHLNTLYITNIYNK